MTIIKKIKNPFNNTNRVNLNDKPIMEEAKPKIISDIVAASNIDEVYSFLDNAIKNKTPEMKKLSNTVYQIKDYFVRLGMSFNTDALIQNLKDLDSLNLSCAPKFISSKQFKDGSTVLITRIENFLANTPAKPFNEVQQDIPLASKSKFMEDVNKLLGRDIMNPAILDSTQNWYVIPETNRIYIDDWQTLTPVYSTIDKSKCRKTITDMCGLIYE